MTNHPMNEDEQAALVKIKAERRRQLDELIERNGDSLASLSPVLAMHANRQLQLCRSANLAQTNLAREWLSGRSPEEHALDLNRWMESDQEFFHYYHEETFHSISCITACHMLLEAYSNLSIAQAAKRLNLTNKRTKDLLRPSLTTKLTRQARQLDAPYLCEGFGAYLGYAWLNKTRNALVHNKAVPVSSVSFRESATSRSTTGDVTLRPAIEHALKSHEAVWAALEELRGRAYRGSDQHALLENIFARASPS